MAYDNVIILGAGASFDAGIPLMSNFVDTMWGYSVRGRTHNAASTEDRQLLARADEIRLSLERYNTRANFNMRNLEDILSLLSFEALAGGEALEKYQTWVRAITRTVELSTYYPYQPDPSKSLAASRSLYHEFWNTLLGEKSEKPPPALITFNYDLVFERTLWNYFHGLTDNNAFKPKRETCKVNYSLRPYDFTIKAEQHYYDLPIPNSRPMSIMRYDGYAPSIQYNREADIEIPYLKLHGSLNWCSRTTPKQDESIPDNLGPSSSAIQAVETPLILPPVFNKMNSGNVNSVWRKALEILRDAKHIIIVGYSLPKTDIYMQYFLKSAVGPNSSLQRITVFDPTLFQNDASNSEMRKRYRECFSPQFQEQITFEPSADPFVSQAQKGTFFHFVRTLNSSREQLLFVP